MLEKRFSSLKVAESCVNYSDLYTKDEIVFIYTSLKNDNRVNAEKKNGVLDKLRKIYKNK